jgi:hypothetical protein
MPGSKVKTSSTLMLARNLAPQKMEQFGHGPTEQPRQLLHVCTKKNSEKTVSRKPCALLILFLHHALVTIIAAFSEQLSAFKEFNGLRSSTYHLTQPPGIQEKITWQGHLKQVVRDMMITNGRSSSTLLATTPCCLRQAILSIGLSDLKKGSTTRKPLLKPSLLRA